jgi:hypothetical protein
LKRINLILLNALMFLAASAWGQTSPVQSFESLENERFWQVDMPTDSTLNQLHALMPYMKAAVAKELPVRYFRELIAANAAVVVSEGNWPSYKPGLFAGGTIYIQSASNPSAWTRNEWSSFYNELFHAWFGNIFMKSGVYASVRALIKTEERRQHYVQAYPSDPWLAQEEAWSETVGTLMITLAPFNFGNGFKYVSMADCAYAIDRTVAPVSHSDRPGYTPEAETTYPSAWEYNILFETLTYIHLPR